MLLCCLPSPPRCYLVAEFSPSHRFNFWDHCSSDNVFFVNDNFFKNIFFSERFVFVNVNDRPPYKPFSLDVLPALLGPFFSSSSSSSSVISAWPKIFSILMENPNRTFVLLFLLERIAEMHFSDVPIHHFIFIFKPHLMF